MPFTVEDPLQLLADPAVLSRTAAFTALPPHEAPATSVCLLQGEVGLLTPAAPSPALPPFLGSSDATTCCLVFVRSSTGTHQAAGHLDFAEALPCFYAMLEAAGFFACSGLEVALVGSYAGGEDCEALVSAVLRTLHSAPCPLTLTLAAVLDRNPLASGTACASASGGSAEGAPAPTPSCRPAFTAATLNTATGEVRPAVFASEGPQALERACRCFIRGLPEPLVCAWADGVWAQPQLPACASASASASASARGGGGGSAPSSARGLSWGIPARDCARYLAMPDAELLKRTSTSPTAEAPGYAARMRKVLSYILQASTAGAAKA